MSLPRLLAWLLGALVVVSVLVLVFSRVSGGSPYDAAERAAIDAEWLQLEELARVPPLPAGAVVADDLITALGSTTADDGALAAFADWMADPGPHRVAHRDPSGELSRDVITLLEAASSLAREGQPRLLPGLLELAHALRTEGRLVDLTAGMRLTTIVLARPELAELVSAEQRAAWAPHPDELRRAQARDAVALVTHLSSVAGDTMTVEFTPKGATTASSVAVRQPRDVLLTALKRAALDGLPADTASATAPRQPSTWDLLSAYVFGEPTALEHELRMLVAPATATTSARHSDLCDRWAAVFAGRPAGAGEPHGDAGAEATPAVLPEPGAGPGEAALPDADGPPGG